MHERLINLLGALAIGLTDRITLAIDEAAGQGATAPAALRVIAATPGGTIEHLRHHLTLTHSGAVRLVDRLVAAGLVVRTPGKGGRSLALQLTPAGQAAAHAVHKARIDAIAPLITALPHANRGEIEMLIALLVAELASLSGATTICRLCDRQSCDVATCPSRAADRHAFRA